MCVAFFTLEHPDYALILCSNRDEFLSRPTEFAHFHSFEQPSQSSEHPRDPDGFVLSGIDVQAGGTWLGLTKAGKVALLTNITEETNAKFVHSRGYLVSSFLAPRPSPSPSSPLTGLGQIEIDEYVRGLVSPSQPERTPNTDPDARYAGFNLLLLVPQVSHSSHVALHGANQDSFDLHKAAATSHYAQPLHSPPSDRPTRLLGTPTPSSQGSAQPNPSLSYDAYLVTNHGAGGEITYRPLTRAERRYGGQSNGVDGRGGEGWFKVKKGLDGLQDVIKLGEDGDAVPKVAEDKIIEELFELLTWTSPVPPTCRRDLRNTIQVDPIAIGAGRWPETGGTNVRTMITNTTATNPSGNVATTINTPPAASSSTATPTHSPPAKDYYATRLATVVIIKRTGEVVFIERDRWMMPPAASSVPTAPEVDSAAESRADAGADARVGTGTWTESIAEGKRAEVHRGEKEPVLAPSLSSSAQRVYRFRLDI
ncbi:NRDE protein-domain-containing protein [Scleroderma yunnanense]